jgi:hypothetical protein
MPRARPLAHRTFKTKGTLSYEEWAAIMVEESGKLGIKMTPRQIAEGLGVIESESHGNTSESSQGPGGHIGAYQESPAFGSTAERLDPHKATNSAIKEWAAEGKNWWPDWGTWETGQSEGPGPTRFRKFLPTAEKALKGIGGFTSGGTLPPAAAGSGAAPARDTGAGGLAGDLMHAGLVGVLVLGGFALVGLGAQRMLGTAAPGGR